jgi:hypothetical protein
MTQTTCDETENKFTFPFVRDDAERPIFSTSKNTKRNLNRLTHGRKKNDNREEEIPNIIRRIENPAGRTRKAPHTHRLRSVVTLVQFSHGLFPRKLLLKDLENKQKTRFDGRNRSVQLHRANSAHSEVINKSILLLLLLLTNSKRFSLLLHPLSLFSEASPPTRDLVSQL